MFVFAAGYTGTTKNLQFVLNTQKSPYLNQATQKNTCHISRNRKFQPPQKSFDHPRHLKKKLKKFKLPEKRVLIL